MAYNEEKLTKLKSLKLLAERIGQDFATKASVAELAGRVDDLVTAGGEPNVITAVKVNGEALPVADKAVDITVPTGKDIADAVAAADHLKRKIAESAEDIDLTAADADQYIYMVLKESGGNDDKYDEYMVIDGAVEKVGDWAVDLSGFVQKENGKGLSSNDFTDADKAKLDGLEPASDEEVSAMLAEVFGEA